MIAKVFKIIKRYYRLLVQLEKGYHYVDIFSDLYVVPFGLSTTPFPFTVVVKPLIKY